MRRSAQDVGSRRLCRHLHVVHTVSVCTTQTKRFDNHKHAGVPISQERPHTAPQSSPKPNPNPTLQPIRAFSQLVITVGPCSVTQRTRWLLCSDTNRRLRSASRAMKSNVFALLGSVSGSAADAAGVSAAAGATGGRAGGGCVAAAPDPVASAASGKGGAVASASAPCVLFAGTASAPSAAEGAAAEVVIIDACAFDARTSSSLETAETGVVEGSSSGAAAGTSARGDSVGASSSTGAIAASSVAGGDAAGSSVISGATSAAVSTAIGAASQDDGCASPALSTTASSTCQGERRKH
jgi:hypothetical protein